MQLGICIAKRAGCTIENILNSDLKLEDVRVISELIAKENAKKNKKKFGIFKKIGGNFFDSEYSYATLKVQETRAAMVAFHGENNLIVVTKEGKYYRAEIPENGGKCVIRETIDI